MDVTAVEEEKTTNSEAKKKAILPGENSWKREYHEQNYQRPRARPT
jgi:hypothetical protein